MNLNVWICPGRLSCVDRRFERSDNRTVGLSGAITVGNCILQTKRTKSISYG